MIERYCAKNRWFIVLTVLVAILLDILPLPAWVIWLRPEWSVLAFIYWVMALPYLVGIGWGFLLGLILDLLNGTLLGEHALAFVILGYAILKIYQLVRVYPLLQQTAVIFLLLFLYNLCIFIIQGCLGQLPHLLLYWLTVITSTILWPWVFILLRDWRRRLNVT